MVRVLGSVFTWSHHRALLGSELELEEKRKAGGGESPPLGPASELGGGFQAGRGKAGAQCGASGPCLTCSRHLLFAGYLLMS